MSIIRVAKNKDNPYLIMNKTVLEDKRLSLKAKGLCCYLLGKPDDWYISTDEIISNSKNGIKSIWSAIKELVKYGYMYKHQFRKEDGKYHSYNYLIFENPGGTPLKKTTTSPNRPFRSSDKVRSDNGTLLSNKTKINNKTLLQHSVVKSNNVNVAQEDFDLKESKKQTSLLLGELYISNHQILFDNFNNFDIFTYADWMLTFKSRINNPTGFIIVSLLEESGLMLINTGNYPLDLRRILNNV
ncbi:unnamed protein product [marine sediment metagenome]|uniref:Helix-turn-helix domain-containing protein n=1 Tax=marine sediment metagenome TaxID=412755 RepID=X1Q9A0_9ZZZZ